MEKGIKVKMVNCAEARIYGDKVWITRSESWQMGNGAEVILLEGKSGGFAVENLQVVKEN